MSLPLIQNLLKAEDVDGWLFYDFAGKNPLVWEVLNAPAASHVTRPFFYWIPKSGEPVKIVHKIEAHVLEALPGEVRVYAQREELPKVLQSVIAGKKVAMEVSKTLPKLSLIDGATVELVEEKGARVHSSATLIQKALSLLDEEEMENHREAGRALDAIANNAFSYVREKHRAGQKVFEGEVQERILRGMEERGFVTEYLPIVARGENSASPHYTPKEGGEQILPEDFLLLDLWCKKKGVKGIFADITRVGAPKGVSQKIQEVFAVVREAQRIAVRFIETTFPVRGADVDTKVREYLESKGYKENIFHRLGHSIDEELHGRGANLDSFESFEERLLLPGTCYSVEPALYFPGEFGLRLEHDILYLGEGLVEVTGGTQEALVQL